MDATVVTTNGLVKGAMISTIELRDSLLKNADNLVNTAMDKGIDATPFRQYRQALRDIPQIFSNAQDVVWPTKPLLPSASV